MFRSVLALAVTIVAAGQTTVDLSRQARRADFANFTNTRPWRLVDTLPATCEAGEAVFVASGLAGQQLYFCTAQSAWNAYSTTSAQVRDILDLIPYRDGASRLGIGPTCSTGAPCRARLGERNFTLTSPAVVTLSGPTGTGVIYAWIDGTGVRMGSSGGGVLACNDYCSVVTGTVTAFPPGVLPLAAATYTNNLVDEVMGFMDQRAWIGGQRIEPGPSANVRVTLDEATGAALVDLAPALDFGGLTETRIVKRGAAAARPSSCSPGSFYYQTDGAAGLYDCPVNQFRGPLVPPPAAVPEIAQRLILAGQTGAAPASTLLATGHEARPYRICAVASVTTAGAGNPALTLNLSWRSPASSTSLSTALIAALATTVTGEEQACRVIHSTGGADVTLTPSNVNTAVYTIAVLAEKL